VNLNANNQINSEDFMNYIVDYIYEIFRVVIYPIENKRDWLKQNKIIVQSKHEFYSNSFLKESEFGFNNNFTRPSDLDIPLIEIKQINRDLYLIEYIDSENQMQEVELYINQSNIIYKRNKYSEIVEEKFTIKSIDNEVLILTPDL
jgi:hypothetical protein